MNKLTEYLGFDPRQHKMRTEILAGLTTFLTMAYILAVNPSIFSALPDMPAGAIFTATAVSAMAGTLLMAFIARMPFGIAPGMNFNSYFVFTICIGMGYSWQFALTAVFLEGLIFVLLTVAGLREALVKALPQAVCQAIPAGIGLFIAMIGLKSCGFLVSGADGTLSVGNLTAPSSLFAFFGLMLIVVLYYYRVKGALLLGILITAIVGIPLGFTGFNGVVSMPHSIAPIFMQFRWDQVFTFDMLVVLFTLVFLDVFDTLGTVMGVCHKAGLIRGRRGTVPRLKQIFLSDALATTIGACLGTSTNTTYIESSAGVVQGGRTGVTSLVIGLCFGAAIFLSPLFISLPAAATGPVLIVSGALVLDSLKQIKWKHWTESLPALVCVLAMPLNMSVTDGIIYGTITYVVINLFTRNIKHINIGMLILTAIFLAKVLLF